MAKVESDQSSALRMEIGSKIEELKEVYLTFTKLQSLTVDRMEEQIKALTTELALSREEVQQAKHATVKESEQLSEVKAELEKAKTSLAETQNTLRIEENVKQRIKNLYRETMNELSHAKRAVIERNEKIAQGQRDLKSAKNRIVEQEQQIAEMENFILGMSSAEDDDLDAAEPNDSEVIDIYNPRGDLSNETVRSTSALSPIPEENPSEIPDYYDAINAYVSSLQISIGSDILSFDDQDVNEKCKTKDEPEGEKAKRKRIRNVPSEASCISSDKENSRASHQSPKKKRLRYRKLYDLAYY